MLERQSDEERRAHKIEFLKMCVREFGQDRSYFDHLRKAAEDNLAALEAPTIWAPGFRELWGNRPHGGYVTKNQPSEP